MSLLKALASDETIAPEKDSIGGSGPLESGLYPMTIAMAHIKVADSGAMGLVLTMKTEDKKEVRQTLWMTAGKAKGGNNYYTDKNGDKQYLPGYLQANAIALLAAGKEISEMDTEEKVIPLWNADAKAEVPTKVPAIMDLIGKEIIVGLIKQTVDKTTKNDAGTYVPTGETREENEIDKIFRASDKMTTAEIRAQATEPTFYTTWEAKWTGVTKSRAKGATGTAGAPGAKAAGASTKPTTSLFG